MSFDTYANLLAEFRDWTDRTDRDSQFDSFLRLIELDVADFLKLRSQDKTDTGTLLAGVNTILSPVGILYPREIVFSGAAGRPVIINATSLQRLQEVEFNRSGSTPPIVATVHGVDATYKTQILVAPTPASNQSYTLRYTDSIQPLNTTNTVTYLLKVHADVYHWGLQMHNAVFDKDWENAAVWRAAYESSKRRARNIEWRSRLVLGRNRVQPDSWTP